MQYQRLGRSGLQVSRICLGMMSYGSPQWRDWVLDEDAARPFIKRAVELGITFFDSADSYSHGVSEQITGKLLREFTRREEVVIATKVYFAHGDYPNAGGLSRKHIMGAVDRSLKNLGTDYIDLYQIHRWDANTPIDETMEALHDLVKSGRVRYIGASSMFAWQFTKAQYTADLHNWTRFVSMQNHYNLIYREEEREMNPFCIEEGIGLIPWSPMARGVLAGNRKKLLEGQSTRSKSDALIPRLYIESDMEIVNRVEGVAMQHSVSAAQIALAWVLAQRGVVAPIIGATKMHHLEQAVAALDVGLSAENLTYLQELYQPHPVSGHPFPSGGVALRS